jgi:hypothetical protein
MKMTKRVFFTAVIFLVIVFTLATIWAVKNLSLPKNAASGQNPNGETTVLAPWETIHNFIKKWMYRCCKEITPVSTSM